MKIKKYLFLFLSSFVIFSNKHNLFSFYWTESTKSDFDQGYVFRTTVTADGKIQLREWEDWWNTAWSIRIPIEINNLNNPSTLTDYQITFSTDLKSYVDTNKLDPQGTSIRITGSDGKTLQNFWIENWNITTSTGSKFWVRVSTIPANNITYIYMYLNNVSTNSLSNRDSVFDLYEDWETGQIRTTTPWSPTGWVQGGNRPFVIHTSTDVLINYQDNGQPSITTGTFSVFGGKFDVTNSTIGHNQTSTLSTQLTLSMPGIIEFKWAASCEGGDSDILEFLVGGERKAKIGSFPNFGWQSYSTTLPAGNNSLQWRYKKDGSDTRYFDRGWIDDVVVRKYTPNPPQINVKSLEQKSAFYTYGYFLSKVFDTQGDNTNFIYTSWTVITHGNSNIKVFARSTHTIFSQLDSVISFSGELTNNSDPSFLPNPPLNNGRFIQYKIEFFSDGSTTPVVSSINFEYKPIPLRAYDFKGEALSSTTIKWSWTNRATYYIDGYRIYSATRVYPSNWLITTSTESGLLAELSADTTFWIETNLTPNTRYGRYVVAYTTTIHTFAGNASRNINNQDDSFYKYTLALEPDVAAEKYVEISNPPYYNFVEISTQVWYNRIYEQYYSSNNFSFTSKLSTGIGQIAYYRYIFQTTTSWSDVTSSFWHPSSFTYRNQFESQGIIERPILFVTPLRNSASWYFMIRSYNYDNDFSGEKILGPFWFNGCPARITDLATSTGKEEEGKVTLSWTVPTEDAEVGNLNNARYIIKFRSDELGGIIDTELKFNSITTIVTSSGIVSGTVIVSTTVLAGTRVFQSITGLVPGRNYWFSIRTLDKENNISEISISTDSLLSRSVASKVHRLEFVTSPQIIFAGAVSQKIIVRTVDIGGDTISSRFGAECSLVSSPLTGEFSTDGINFGINRLYILPNTSTGEFYFRSNTAGDFNLTVSEIQAYDTSWNGSQGWVNATQIIKILPRKAVSFTAVPQDGSYNSRIMVNKPIFIDAIDSVGNRFPQFQGVAIVTTTVPGVSVVPSSITFSLSDSGRKSVVLQNPHFAGPVSLTIREVLNQDYKFISFVDMYNGNIVGSKGIVKTTDDSGNKWFTQYYQDDSYYGLNSIDVEGNITIAVGNNGTIIRSTDTFISHTSTTISTQDLNDVYFINSSTLIICGNNGVIYKSTDSGLTYNLKNSGVTENLHSMSFISDTTGYFCGRNSTLLKTFDGGETFEQLSISGTDFYKIKFVSEQIGYMVGANGVFFKTTDGGITWSSKTIVAGKTFFGLDFYTATKGVVCGENGMVYLTTNGGNSFTNISPPNTNNETFYTLDYIGATTIIVAGSNGSMYKTTDDGLNWTRIVMEGTSPVFEWNGIIISTIQVNYSGRLLQSGSLNIANVAVRFRYNHPGIPTTRINNFTIKKLGSLDDSYVQSVQVYLGNQLLGSGVFVSSTASIPLTSQPIISFNPSTFTIRVNLTNDAPIDATFALLFDFGCIQRSQGLEFARNNLPYITYKDPATQEYFLVEPPAVNVYLVDVDTKTYVFDGIMTWSTSTVAEQGDIVQMLKFGLITERSQSPFRKLRLNLVGTNITDVDIKRVRIYQDSLMEGNLISSGTFSGGIVVLDINKTIRSDTTSYFYITAEISPDSGFSSSAQEVNFAFRSLITTTYFLLDASNVNSIVSQVSGISSILQSQNVRIEVSRDVVYIRPLPDLVAQLPVSIKQGQRGILLPIGVSIDDGAATWSRLRVDQISNATNNYTRFGRSSSTLVEVWRDNGNGLLDGNDTKLGEGKFENNSALVVFNQPERIDADFVRESLSKYATYFITCYIPKNAIPEEKIRLRLAASTYFTLGGVDIVSGNNFPFISPEITITDFDDDVEAKITSFLQSETVLFEKNVLVASVDLLAEVDATLKKLTIVQEGTADNNTVSLVKVYLDNGDLKFNPANDIVVSTGVFNSVGRCELVFFNPSNILLYDPVLVLDTGVRLFITFDFNLNANPGKTIGVGIDPSGFTYNLPNRQKNFSYFTSDKTITLDRRSPTKPQIFPIISGAKSIDTGRIISNPIFYTPQVNQIKFNWFAEAPYGGGIKRGFVGLSTKKPAGVNDTPNIRNFVSVDISTNILSGLNLRSGNLYYLWLKAESNDGFARINYVPIVVDNTSPRQSPAPKVSPPSENSYWLNSELNFDEETFLVSVEIEERKNNQLLWTNIKTIDFDLESFISNFYLDNFEKSVSGNIITISTRIVISETDLVEYIFNCTTTTVYGDDVFNFETLFLSKGLKINSMYINLESKIKDKEEKNFYYYKLRTKNSAGLYSAYSENSKMAYLSLPDEKLSFVSTFPNPVDVRKNIATISYVLNQDMDIKIRIFDLAGNLVYETSIDSGAEGAKMGPNFVEWKESKNVASGMYLLLIEGRTSTGEVVKKKWKIGVVK